MRCKDCEFKSNIGNTETCRKGVCTFMHKYLPIDIDSECFLSKVVLKLDDFHFIKEELPEDFEVCLIVLRNGKLTAGCWDTGLYSRKDGEPGAFRQSRGMTISLDSVWAWLPIEEYSLD